MAIFTGALVKGMIGGAIKERASKMGKSKVGKLLGREKRVMTGQPHPKAEVSDPKTVQPQQSLVPSPILEGSDQEGQKNFATEKEAKDYIKNET